MNQPLDDIALPSSKAALASGAARPLKMVVLRPARGWPRLNLAELWEYHELLYFFVWRDVKVRYKQAVLGGAWAIIQPVVTMIVFSIFFGRLAKMPSDGLPYPIFAYVALVPWTLFANGLLDSSSSVVGSSNLLKKVYFPRLLIPAATVASGLIDFILAFSVLIALMLWYGIAPTWRVVMVVPLVALACTTALGCGLWLAALNVRFRDVRYVLPFFVQAWMFATPVAYPASLVPNEWKTLYALNPMVGVIEGFRWALLGSETTSPTMALVSAGTSLAILIGGAYFFRRMESSFADLV